MTFSEEDVEAWKRFETEQSEVWDKYRKVQEAQPDYDKQFGRSFDYPRYTDKYDTNTEFSLRELLLLIWWGKFKKGRLTTAKIPKYFIFTYNLNVQKVTQKFIDKGWLVQKMIDTFYLKKHDKLQTFIAIYGKCTKQTNFLFARMKTFLIGIIVDC